MKVTQEVVKQPEVFICKRTGAKAGDKVLFSSHNKNNKNLLSLSDHGIATNKVYTIGEVHGSVCILCPENSAGYSYAGLHGHIGEFDIIERSPDVKVEKVFSPVTITLDNIQQVRLFAELFGAIEPSITDPAGFVSYRELYDPLNAILKCEEGVFARRRFAVFEKF